MGDLVFQREGGPGTGNVRCYWSTTHSRGDVLSAEEFDAKYPGLMAAVKPQGFVRYRWDGVYVYQQRTEPHGDPCSWSECNAYHEAAYPIQWWAVVAAWPDPTVEIPT